MTVSFWFGRFLRWDAYLSLWLYAPYCALEKELMCFWYHTEGKSVQEMVNEALQHVPNNDG